MLDNYDLWQAKQTVDLKKVHKIEFRYAYRLRLVRDCEASRVLNRFLEEPG